jgi:sec-independent protein translocase protein TatA
MMVGHLQPIAFLEMPGGGEWVVIAFIALLIFGRRLPEVARSFGKSINEFKKGMREFQDKANEVVNDVHKTTNDAVSESDRNDSYASQTATLEGSPGSYESQTTSEPTPQAGAGQAAAEPASHVNGDANPDKSAPSATPTDTFHEPMS